MLKFKPYFYHSKNDSKQEPIDKIIALSYQDALQYFAEKKQMDEYRKQQIKQGKRVL